MLWQLRTTTPACRWASGGVLAVMLASVVWASAQEQSTDQAGPRFVVSVAESLLPSPLPAGRLVLILGRPGDREPRRNIGRTGLNAPPLFGIDTAAVNSQSPPQWVVDRRAAAFPVASLADVPAGKYVAQAVLMVNRDLCLPSAPGNLVSDSVPVDFDPRRADTFRLQINQRLPEQRPTDSARIKYLHFPSKLLSDFHGRPMVYRAAVILPPQFDQEPDRRFPLVVHIGGFGTRYTFAPALAAQTARGPATQFLHLLLDGAGPFGDPYQVNSANNGPYGDALTQELIPYVEQNFRGMGLPQARFTTGASTGGWVSVALQIFYPDFFNGCWSQCPDSLDFRSFELINIYEDKNAYVNRWGFERPAKRTVEGDTIYTVRHECQIENVLGRGDNWALGGRDWGSWNAAYGPRGPDGLPIPLWHPKTGAINAAVLHHWRKYDLRLVVQENWSRLGPKLNGKLNIWVGDADDYFLNNGVHHFKRMTDALRSPPFQGTILIEMRKPHTSGGWTDAQMYEAMLSRVPPPTVNK